MRWLGKLHDTLADVTPYLSVAFCYRHEERSLFRCFFPAFWVRIDGTSVYGSRCQWLRYGRSEPHLSNKSNGSTAAAIILSAVLEPVHTGSRKSWMFLHFMISFEYPWMFFNLYWMFLEFCNPVIVIKKKMKTNWKINVVKAVKNLKAVFVSNNVPEKVQNLISCFLYQPCLHLTGLDFLTGIGQKCLHEIAR